VEIIEELHKLGMRSVQAIVETMGYMEESLIASIMERAAQEQKIFNRDEVAKATRYVLTILISGMVRGMINMVASSLNSPLLLPAATEALTNDNSISALLVIQELKLNYLKAPDYEELEKLNSNLVKANNKFAQFVLSRIACALKNTPEPTTVPTTIHIAIRRPYCFLRPFAFSISFHPFPKIFSFITHPSFYLIKNKAFALNNLQAVSLPNFLFITSYDCFIKLFLL
jgi:hypothetical protein